MMRKPFDRRQFLTRGVSAAGGAALGYYAAPAFLRAADRHGADLVGRFVFDGAAPERKKLKVDKDVDCCGKFDIRDESVMVAGGGGLMNVFVYVRTRNVAVDPGLVEKAGKRVTLDNRDCIFKPHCMAIWLDKQEFHIVNSDPVAQNVAFSPPGDAPANIVLPVAKDATWKFTRRQLVPVPIACNYHPWESAYILPREDPYVAISGQDGFFRISRLPVGKLEFQAWHERVGYLQTSEWVKGRFEIALKPGTNDLGTIKLPASLFQK